MFSNEKIQEFFAYIEKFGRIARTGDILQKAVCADLESECFPHNQLATLFQTPDHQTSTYTNKDWETNATPNLLLLGGRD